MDRKWFKQMAELFFVIGIVATDDKEHSQGRNYFAGHCEGYY